MPLINVCTDMELRGVAIREDYAKELSVALNKEMVETEAKCDEYVAQFSKYIEEHPTLMRLTKGSKKINYNSPQQVACLFYDIFKLKSVSRKEPRGTGDPIIQQHRNKAQKMGTKKAEEFIEFLDNYQRYKECNKLIGTYIDKIPAVKCEKTNAVHTTFNQYGARTGRFSSSDKITKVNLQNIPSHEKRIRKIFKAREGYKLVGGDFSQIEPRVLAYVSGDEAMQDAYKHNKDLYAIMGSQVYNMPYEDCREFYPDGTVNPEGKHRRTTMKSVLLGRQLELCPLYQ
jgi:DNA polymerase I-like protein with 3'-5' exonuclease and polymerase domains